MGSGVGKARQTDRQKQAKAGNSTVKRKTDGLKVIQFIERYAVHPDGPLVGQPFLLHPFWKQVILELFERVWDDEEQRWRRRYSEALIGVPKKNSKSSVAACLALYFLLADGDPSSLVICAAASEEQSANLLFGSAKTICELSPALKQLTAAFDREILVPSLSRARLKNVAAKAGTQDGHIGRAVICDELHEWKGQRGRDLYTVLRGSLGARPDAMSIAITTAGFDQDSVCYERYEYGQKVQAGEIQDDRFYFKWVEAPDDCDHRDPKFWRMANPLYGASVLPSYLEDRCKREQESVFRRYHLNKWVASEEIWIPYGVWAKGQSDEQLDPNEPLFVGIDIAKNIDTAAMAMVQRRIIDGELYFVVRSKIWSNPYREDDPRFADWRMNNQLVMEECRRLFREFPKPACMIDDEIKPGPALAYDPWRFRSEAETLTGEGLAMVEFPQTDTRMVPASQALYEAIMSDPIRILHSGDLIEKRHIENVTPDQRERGWRISKPKGSKRKIDFAVALAIGVYQAQLEPPKPPVSVYETRGLLSLE